MQRHVQSDVVFDIEFIRELKIEADTIEASYGPNPYSTYLRSHGKRPDPEQAATIGKLLGGQVKASDGTMQPPLSAANRKALKDIRARRKAAARRYEQLISLQNAITALAKIEDNPAELVRDGSCVLDGPALFAQIDPALSYLKRFAEYWHDRTRSKDEDGIGSRHQRNGA